MHNLSTKKLVIIGVALVAILLIAVGLTSSKNGAVNTTNSNTQTVTSTAQSPVTSTKAKTTTTTTAPKVYSGSVVITILSNSFSPKTITIKAGTTVTWINKDSVAHKIIADNGGPTSSDLFKNQTYTFKFSAKGIYGYSEANSATTTGTIIVN